MPRITVILPVFNGERYLAEAIESILAQTCKDFEFLIVDDASTDQTSAILARFGDPRIRVLRNDLNLGVARSLNKALRQATGKYVARQDADDVSLPGRLEKQVHFLEAHPEVALVSTGWALSEEEGTDRRPAPPPRSEVDLKWTLLFYNPIAHMSVMMKREAVEACGAYPEDTHCSCVEDYALWSQMSERFRLATLPEELVLRRVSHQAVSVKKRELQDQQVKSISLRSLSSTLGCPLLSVSDYDLLCAAMGAPAPRLEKIPLTRMRWAMNSLDRLLDEFYSKHKISPAEAAEHRARLQWAWGRHYISLSLRARSTLRWRFSVLFKGVRLLFAISLLGAQGSVVRFWSDRRNNAQMGRRIGMGPRERATAGRVCPKVRVKPPYHAGE
ncbi:MAG: glycosyltransferase [Terriglobales bacterium]|jgi:hypothetical protein